MTVTPSPAMLTEAEAPRTVVGAIVCAPLALKVIWLTPLPTSLALRETRTFVLFHPAALGAGDGTAVVTGAGTIVALSEALLLLGLASPIPPTLAVLTTGDETEPPTLTVRVIGG